MPVFRVDSIIISIIITIASCDFQKSKNSSKAKTLSEFYKDAYTNNIIPSLKLENLKTDNHSYEIRLFTHPSKHKYGQLLVIKKLPSSWECSKYTFWKNTSDNPYSFTIDTFSVEKLIPKSGWKEFHKNLLSLNPSLLGNQNDITNWKEKNIEDGTIYLLEYRNKGKYGLSYYHCPEVYKEYENSRQMVDLLNLFKEEFDFEE